MHRQRSNSALGNESIDVVFHDTIRDDHRSRPKHDGSFKLPPVTKPLMSADSFFKLDSLSKIPFTKKKEQSAGPVKRSVSETKYITLDTSEPLPTIGDVIDASTLEDVVLKKALTEVFASDKDSYVSAIQEMVTRANSSKGKAPLPKSLIPREYHIYSSSPIIKKDSDRYDTTYNEQRGTWEKLIFPSNEPHKRQEIYLLAKAMDNMLHNAKEIDRQNKPQSEQDHFESALDNLERTFQIHNIAFYELVRQVFVSCIERGVLMDKIYEFMNSYHERTMELLLMERRRSNERQNLVERYERMIDKLQFDKEDVRDQMYYLMLENKDLFSEREVLKRKVAELPKYELVMRILKGQSTWEQFETEMKGSMAASIIADHEQRLEKMRAEEQKRKQIEANKRRKQGRNTDSLNERGRYHFNLSDRTHDRTEDEIREEESLHRHRAALLLEEERKNSTNERLARLIQTNMSDTLYKLNGFSVEMEQEFSRNFTTAMNVNRLKEAKEDLLQHILSAVYDVNSRIQEMHTVQQARKKQRQIEERQRQAMIDSNTKNDIKVVLKSEDNPEGVSVAFFDLSNIEEQEGAMDSGAYIQSLEESMQKMVSDVESYKAEIDRMEQELAMRQESEETDRSAQQTFRERTEQLESENAELLQRLADLEDLARTVDIPDGTTIVVEGDISNVEEDPTRSKHSDAELKKRKNTNPRNREGQYGLNRGGRRGASNLSNNAHVGSVGTPVGNISSFPDAPIQRGGNVVKNTDSTRENANAKPHRETQNTESERKPGGATKSTTNPNITINTNTSTTEKITHHTPSTNHENSVTNSQAAPRRGSVSKPRGGNTNVSESVTAKLENIRRARNNVTHTTREIAVQTEEYDTDVGAEIKYTHSGTAHITNGSTVKQNVKSAFSSQLNSRAGTATQRPVKSPQKRRNMGEAPKDDRLGTIFGRHVRFKKDGQPKSLPWLLTLVNKVYELKIQHSQTMMSPISDVSNSRPTTTGTPPLLIPPGSPMHPQMQRASFAETVFDYLKQQYGTQELVDQYAGALMATIIKCRVTDKRTQIFANFVEEEWDFTILDRYLQVFQMIKEEKRLGPEYYVGQAKTADDVVQYPVRISKVRVMSVLRLLAITQPALVEAITALIEDKYEEVTEKDFANGLKNAGYKYVPNQWNSVEMLGVDDQDARKAILKCDFLDIVCKVTLAQQEETRNMNQVLVNTPEADIQIQEIQEGNT